MKAKRKFVIIGKVDKSTWVKYRSNNLENFIKFFTTKYPNAFFFNAYFNTGELKGKICHTWGKNKGLIKN